MFRFLLAIFALATAIPVDANECSEILSQGIYDIRSNASDLNTASSFSQWFCDKKFSDSKQANTFGASLSFPFEDLPVKLGFDSSSQNWSEWYSSFCGRIQHDQSLQSSVREYVQTVNPQIVQAFNSCIESDGLHVWLERTYNPKLFRFAARFNPPNAKNPKARINKFSPGSNVSCEDKPETIDRPVWRTNCTRINNDPVSIVVRADWNPLGGGKLELPAIAQVPPPYLPPHLVTLGTCKGYGGLTGVTFWGPVGSNCNGLKEWGKYQTDLSNPKDKICSCKGHGGVEGITLWGPKGEACGGFPEWGTYSESCVNRTESEICSCIGRGGLEGHEIWGAKNQICGGFINWGLYAQRCTK
jgi:hypothetical protein